jgi:hypothetical protein
VLLALWECSVAATAVSNAVDGLENDIDSTSDAADQVDSQEA